MNNFKNVTLAEMNVAYFENLSMITCIDSNSPTLGRCVMKSRDTLSHGLEGTGKGSNRPANFALFAFAQLSKRVIYILLKFHFLLKKHPNSPS